MDRDPKKSVTISIDRDVWDKIWDIKRKHHFRRLDEAILYAIEKAGED